MKLQKVTQNDKMIATAYSEESIITDGQSALDFMMSVQYETKCSSIAVNKEALTEDFFILSSGVAGEVLQKCSNYHIQLAIYGDFSKYTSKPLKDFIYESNNGKTVFFTATLQEALEKLAAV